MKKRFVLLGGASALMAMDLVFAGEVSPQQQEDTGGYTPSVLFDYNYWSALDFDEESGGYNLHSGHFLVPINGSLNDSYAWVLEAEGSYTDLNVFDQPLLRDADLYRLGVDLSVVWLNDSAWSPLVKLEPLVSSDFKKLTSDDFNITATVGTYYQQQDNLKWLVGVGYTNDLNDPTLFPSVGIDWQINENYSLVASGIRADFTYDSQQDWKAGLFADGFLQNWNLETSGAEQELEINSIRVGVSYERKLTSNLWLDTEVGLNFANEIELVDSSGNRIFKDDADSGYFFKIGGRLEL